MRCARCSSTPTGELVRDVGERISALSAGLVLVLFTTRGLEERKVTSTEEDEKTGVCEDRSD